MKITNKYNLPKAIVSSAEKDSHVMADFSVTQMLKGATEIALGRVYGDQLQMDASECINMMFGRAVHALFEEQESEGVLNEHYMTARSFAGFTVWSRFPDHAAYHRHRYLRNACPRHTLSGYRACFYDAGRCMADVENQFFVRPGFSVFCGSTAVCCGHFHKKDCSRIREGSIFHGCHKRRSAEYFQCFQADKSIRNTDP